MPVDFLANDFGAIRLWGHRSGHAAGNLVTTRGAAFLGSTQIADQQARKRRGCGGRGLCARGER